MRPSARSCCPFAMTALLALASAPAAAEPAPVDAMRHSCAELQAMVASAGRLAIRAEHVNPHGGGGPSTHTFVAAPRFCGFIDEWPSTWRIRARDGEVCTGLEICLPRDLYDDPLWGDRPWGRRRWR